MTKAFDLCDDITSGLMHGVCAAHGKRLSDVQRNDALAKHGDAAVRFFRHSLQLFDSR